jgi:hypothetical protein
VMFLAAFLGSSLAMIVFMQGIRLRDAIRHWWWTRQLPKGSIDAGLAMAPVELYRAEHALKVAMLDLADGKEGAEVIDRVVAYARAWRAHVPSHMARLLRGEAPDRVTIRRTGSGS